MRLALKLFVYVTADGWTNVIQRAGDKGQDISIYSECRLPGPARPCPALPRPAPPRPALPCALTRKHTRCTA